MIVLTNVKRIGNIISANYRYSGESDTGYIEYDIDAGKYVRIYYCEIDRKYDVHYGFGKILGIIEKMIKYDKYPETYHYFWY